MEHTICYNVNKIVSVINGKGIDYQLNVSGKQLSLFKSGGIVDLVVCPKNKVELNYVLGLIKLYPIPYHILGNGSNTLILDGGYRGMIILLKSFSEILFNENTALVGCGIKLPYLASLCSLHKLGGLEKLAGIPCSVGGATIKNAGCYGIDFSSLVNKVYCINKFTLDDIIIKREDIDYSYRSSNNSFNNLIITHTLLNLIPTTDDLKEIMKEYALKRKNTQPSEPSLGSVFLKTDNGIGAGFYIDKAGLKGSQIGGAQISLKHANFIVNMCNATSSDYLSLMELAQSVVKKKFNVNLTKEIDIIGEQ